MKKKKVISDNAEPVMLVCGFIYGNRDAYVGVVEEMEKAFSPVQMESEVFDFSHTDYYEKEMGTDLKRCFLSFEAPVRPDFLRECKLITNQIEQRFLNDKGGRLVNIDPGLMTLAGLQLASTKNFAHRLYLGEGIYGEVTMVYEDKSFFFLPWTYPDYKADLVLEFLRRVRGALKDHIIALRQQQ